MSKKKALITGIGGQDGSYLAELLVEKGYEVHGIRRRTSLFNSARIDHLYEEVQNPVQKIRLHYADLADFSSIYKLVDIIKPDEVYNLGAQSHVGVSFDVPEYTGDVVGLGALRVLEAIKGVHPKAKFYQASSSEMFGDVVETPQSEKTPFNPVSPYAVAKVYAYWTTINYRRAYNMFTCNGILFNHESPRRGRTFVTRKISRAVANISLGKQDVLYLGNLDAKRDWGHAKDYVMAMWLMLQQDEPEDYVISSGKSYTVREFVIKAFKEVGIDIVWKGKGLKETGVDKKTGTVLVGVDPLYFRPTEVATLLGDSKKARSKLGWKPEYTFDTLVKELVEFDLNNEKKENDYVGY